MRVPGTYAKPKLTGRKIEVVREQDENHVLVLPDGRTTYAIVTIIPEEEFGGVRAGYICARCIEEHDMPFPENCVCCNFAMRAQQTEYIAREYVGNMHVGPATSLEEEMLRMQEMRAREAQRLGIWTPPGRYYT